MYCQLECGGRSNAGVLSGSGGSMCLQVNLYMYVSIVLTAPIHARLGYVLTGEQHRSAVLWSREGCV